MSSQLYHIGVILLVSRLMAGSPLFNASPFHADHWPVPSSPTSPPSSCPTTLPSPRAPSWPATEFVPSSCLILNGVSGILNLLPLMRTAYRQLSSRNFKTGHNIRLGPTLHREHVRAPRLRQKGGTESRFLVAAGCVIKVNPEFPTQETIIYSKP